MIVAKTTASIAAAPNAKASLVSSRSALVAQKLGNSRFSKSTRSSTSRMQQHLLETRTESTQFAIDTAFFRNYSHKPRFVKAFTATTHGSFALDGTDRCFWTGWKGKQRRDNNSKSNRLGSIAFINPNQRNRFPSHLSRRLFSASSAFATPLENSVGKNNNNNNNKDTINETEADLPQSWKQMYDLLVDYHQEHGSTIVPDRCSDETNNQHQDPAHLEIREWVKVQRQHSRFLSQQQKNLLNQLGFVWDHLEAQWLEKYERLCDYESTLEMSAKEISNIRSSDLESVFEKRYQRDPVLRRWVNAQRQKYRSETISAERVRLLEKVEGFVWDVKDARWFEMHRRLSLFAKEHNGSCIVPQHYAADPQLACWVSNQRHRKHQLSAERINMLDALGFVWDVRELQWMANYENYKAMYFGHSDTDMETTESDHNDNERNTKNAKEDEKSQQKARKEQQQLIDWAIKQRRANRNGSLSAHRKHLLNELVHPIDGSRFVWDPQGQNWMEMYNELLEYRTIHKHVMVPTRSTRYDNEYEDSIGSNDENGICDASTPASSSTNRQLGVWVANQRRNFKKGSLSKKRKKLLDDIDFVWDAPDFVWNDQYQRLVDYQKQHLAEGKERATSTVVPQHYAKDPQLAVWVKEQRQNRKNGILTGERLDLLETIGFVWDASSSPPPS